MKVFVILFLLTIFFISCNDSEPQKENNKVLTATEKYDELYKQTKESLSYDQEKIILLSTIRKISFDTLNSILIDYFVLTDTLSSSDENSKYEFQNSIAKISDKYRIKKSKIALLIFSYKYEMYTKEEIEESAVESFKDNYEEEEPLDPEYPY